MKTIFKRLFNPPFIAVKRMKRMKHVGICDLWTAVADILLKKNSEIADNEKNNQNQIGKSYIYSFDGKKKNLGG